MCRGIEALIGTLLFPDSFKKREHISAAMPKNSMKTIIINIYLWGKTVQRTPIFAILHPSNDLMMELSFLFTITIFVAFLKKRE